MVAAQQQKKQQTGADLEREYRALLTGIEQIASGQDSLTNELMTLLSGQAGQVAARQPLQEAHEKAQADLQAARAALSRHIGGPNESAFAEKLHAAERVANEAAAALTNFEKQAAPSAKRIQELRTTISRRTDQLTTMQAQAAELSGQMELVHEEERRESLIKLLSAYADLYDVMEEVGPAIAHMRTDAPAAFNSLFSELQIEASQLWDLLLPSYQDSSLTGYWRPFLAERQANIKARLAGLNKK